MEMHGEEELLRILLLAGFTSFEKAVAALCCFAHPSTVRQTENRNLFPVARIKDERGNIVQFPGGARVMACDNDTPTRVFQWSTGFRGTEVQYNHIYSDSQNVEIYTSLANLCVTPAFLAKLTDKNKAVQALLRYRSYELYGFLPAGAPVPKKPEGYGELWWRPFPEEVSDLESVLRSRLVSCAASRAAIAAREIGWLFSGFQPDSTIRRAA